MPQMGVSVAEGTVVGWRVEVGDRIEADQPICDISSDKIDTEVPAPVTGVVAEIVVPVETTVAVGQVLARIATRDGASPAASGNGAAPAPEVSEAATAASSAGAPEKPRSPGRRCSPVVQRIAAEHDLDLSSVKGTGRGGRVRKQDVMALVNGGPAVEEPPLHIESPYRPEPVAPAVPMPSASAEPAAPAVPS